VGAIVDPRDPSRSTVLRDFIISISTLGSLTAGAVASKLGL
jgi:hypothetical protein